MVKSSYFDRYLKSYFNGVLKYLKDMLYIAKDDKKLLKDLTNIYFLSYIYDWSYNYDTDERKRLLILNKIKLILELNPSICIKRQFNDGYSNVNVKDGWANTNLKDNKIWTDSLEDYFELDYKYDLIEFNDMIVKIGKGLEVSKDGTLTVKVKSQDRLLTLTESLGLATADLEQISMDDINTIVV